MVSTRSKRSVGFATAGTFSIVFKLMLSNSCQRLFSDIHLGAHVNTYLS